MVVVLLAVRARLQRVFRISEWQILLLWSIVAGVLGALATELFRLALHAVDVAVLGSGGGLVEIARSLPVWARVLSPTVGGLIAGLLLVWARRTAAQKATSDYMEAIVLGDGRIPVVQTLARSASSLVSIASGGSIGREGSMVQLAALCASLLGRCFRFPVARLRLIVACGAASGLTAAYNAPIAGAFFVAEIVLGSIAMESVGPIMVAAVVGNIVMRWLPGYQPVYEMPVFPEIHGVEVPLFVLLGVLAGGGAALMLRGLAASRAAFARLPVALPWRLAIGGLIVGCISVWVPEVWGNGYSVVNAVLHSPWPWTALVALLVAKAAATMATTGSGAVGGVFTPALFFGCLLGALFGTGAHALWPGQTSEPFVYAIVGMAALLAGAAQAPIMAILMVFEMTLSYQVMLPLMAGSVVAYFVARSARVGSMYEITVRRQAQFEERERLRAQHVRDLLEPAQTVVGPETGVEEMRRMFLEYPVKYLYLVDAAGHYLGVVPLKSLNAADLNPQQPDIALSFVSQDIEPLHADIDLEQALERLLQHRGERLPVIESLKNPVLLGVVSKSAVLATYVRLSA
ncbi:ClcB-like voltage-gated chloride channel protein [Xylophilus rhododendri]|uniref:ClcB-like voltage-gated chloride channel protein n=1 Tax=Xylophilus rhododendri TaxID=2697032 RepID=A0A857JDE2_9BURK|nr:ClcB-like voltage-gated chloride channel protein [Xylophilus rhododendri]QHJ01658.1 ClcB-like voltage-gated chloride channel protein [Xylophilus rhododendri]